MFKYYPAVEDIACVPTGITKYRDGLYPISDVDGEYSAKLLDLVDSLNKEFGVNFLLPADEYFVKAGRPFKSAEFYGDFEQIENGIGMTAKFISEVNTALADLIEGGRVALSAPKRSVVVSGVSAQGIVKELAEKCNQAVDGLHAEVLAVGNDFFGHTVTCTGLLTGQDIAKALQEYRKQKDFDEVVLAGNVFKEFEDVFLCGMTLDGLKKQLNFDNIRINRDGGYGFVEILSTDRE